MIYAFIDIRLPLVKVSCVVGSDGDFDLGANYGSYPGVNEIDIGSYS